ncbi:MAG: hypothetical protein HW373_1420 [Deltaproteobacteria bacterium]|nr:hypothetical protein [Deltaproteobacteria bacterium]
MDTVATMVEQEISTGAASQSFSALQNVLEAALLSATLVAQPVTHRDQPRDSLFPAFWNQQPNVGEESFHAVPIEQLTQSDQLAAWFGTYKHAAALKELQSLPANWDGQGAERVSQEAIRNAKLFLASLERTADTFEPFADPDGSIGLEGHKGERSAYVVISPEGAISYVVREGDKVNRGADIDANTMRLLLEVLY